MALSPMARQVAGAKEGERAVQEARQEAAACKDSLHALQHSYASSLQSTEAHRQECSRVSLARVTSRVTSFDVLPLCDGHSAIFHQSA